MPYDEQYQLLLAGAKGLSVLQQNRGGGGRGGRPSIIVHGDVKPGNFVVTCHCPMSHHPTRDEMCQCRVDVTQPLTLKLADFGCAMEVVHPDRHPFDELAYHRERSHNPAAPRGTPRYMCPERIYALFYSSKKEPISLSSSSGSAFSIPNSSPSRERARQQQQPSNSFPPSSRGRGGGVSNSSTSSSASAEYAYDATKVDVYSFGLVMWEVMNYLVTGRYQQVFSNCTDREEIFEAACSSTRRPSIDHLCKFVPEISPRVLDVMQDAWSVDPQVRPEWGEVVHVLSKASEPLLQTLAQSRQLRRTRHRATTTMATTPHVVIDNASGSSNNSGSGGGSD